jgi:hypothetical protein
MTAIKVNSHSMKKRAAFTPDLLGWQHPAPFSVGGALSHCSHDSYPTCDGLYDMNSATKHL